MKVETSNVRRVVQFVQNSRLFVSVDEPLLRPAEDGLCRKTSERGAMRKTSELGSSKFSQLFDLEQLAQIHGGIEVFGEYSVVRKKEDPSSLRVYKTVQGENGSRIDRVAVTRVSVEAVEALGTIKGQDDGDDEEKMQKTKLSGCLPRKGMH